MSLDCGEKGVFAGFFGLFVAIFFAFAELAEETGGQALAVRWRVVEAHDGSYLAEGGVGDEFFDDVFLFGGAAAGLDAGQVEAGDLEAVEKKAGAAGVDLVAGDAAKDFADGVLDGAAIFGVRKLKGGASAAAGFGVGDGFPRGVVVLTKIFISETWTATTVSVGEDVAAKIALGLLGLAVHGGGPP